MANVTKNPFTPTFGTVPAILAGRVHLLDNMTSAFANGQGDPNLSTILIGARGTGKTALLSCIATEAERSGWIAVNVIAEKGMLEDIVQRSVEAAGHLIEAEPRRRLTGIDLGQIFGIHWETNATVEANWRTRMNALLGQLETNDIGLLITVDEVRASVDEMIRLASTYQLFVREGKKVALVMAGLPKQVSSLVSNESVSFLRRSRQHYLSSIDDAEVEIAFEKTVESGGKHIDNAALAEAVKAIRGFPYMMQLVGYFSWLECGEKPAMTIRDIQRGVQLAQNDLESGLLEATYREISPGDRRFLMAMLDDTRESRLSDIAKRLGKPNGYTSSYKSRLMAQGIIEELPGGTFAFSLPFFREYLEGIRQAEGESAG